MKEKEPVENEKIPVVNQVAELDEEQDQVAECKTNLDSKDKYKDAEEYDHIND